jgi:TPP-dependent pyruvate/acetoin dehydrogenase alpha subunit
MDVRAVKAAGDKAVQWCREGNGPFILEMQTYRYRGHSMSDPRNTAREEVEKVRHDSDPIEQVRQRLLELKVSEQDLKAIDGRSARSSTRRRISRSTRSGAGCVRALHRYLPLSLRKRVRSDHADSSSDARAFAHDGKGQPFQMAEKRR